MCFPHTIHFKRNLKLVLYNTGLGTWWQGTLICHRLLYVAKIIITKNLILNDLCVCINRTFTVIAIDNTIDFFLIWIPYDFLNGRQIGYQIPCNSEGIYESELHRCVIFRIDVTVKKDQWPLLYTHFCVGMSKRKKLIFTEKSAQGCWSLDLRKLSLFILVVQLYIHSFLFYLPS